MSAEESRSSTATLLPILACNSRCPFCSTRVYTEGGIVSTSDFKEGNRSRNIAEYTISFEQATQSYDRFFREGINSIHLQGGEPTLYERLPELIEYGNRLGFSEQVVVTNGRRFKNIVYSQQLLESNPSCIAISIFGASATLHDDSMGIPGAFDEMLEGVSNLVSLNAKRPRPVHIAAQVILHKKNYETLPEIVEFWHQKGIKYFIIRLLRSTLNTEQNSTNWFFDLSSLKPYLNKALHFILQHKDVAVSLPELPRCLINPDNFVFSLSDLETTKRLSSWTLFESKHHAWQHNSLLTRKVLRSATSICAQCDFDGACAKLEKDYSDCFSGQLRSIKVTDEFNKMFSSLTTEQEILIIRRLLNSVSLGTNLGFPTDQTLILRSRLAQLDELGLFEGYPHIPERLKRHTRRPTHVQYLKATELFPQISPDRDLTELFSSKSSAPPNSNKIVAFLDRASSSIAHPLFIAFLGEVPRRNKDSIPFVVIVYKDTLITEETIRKSLDKYIDFAGEPAPRDTRDQANGEK